jgi:hypothetical protein
MIIGRLSTSAEANRNFPLGDRDIGRHVDQVPALAVCHQPI